MDSRLILEALRSDLNEYIAPLDLVPDVIELYPLGLNFLDERSDIPGIRIGIFEMFDEPGTLAENTNTMDTMQTYGIQLFFRISRKRATYAQAEKLMLEYKDAIYDWGYNLEPSSITNAELLSFFWDGSQQIIRDELYTSMDIAFRGIRNLN